MNIVCDILKIAWKKQKKEVFHTQAQIRELNSVSSISVLGEMVSKLFSTVNNVKKLGENFTGIKYFTGENSMVLL